jgi:N-acetylglucosaminyldiphosphoundecaprenol N-acetyl-beta-D-mannosaminyltransferase
MEAFDNHNYQIVVNNADFIVPDGKPLAIGQRMLGNKNGQQVRGADLTRELLKRCSHNGIILGFYGSTQETIGRITKIIKNDYEDVKLGCAISPPFRNLTTHEDKLYIDQINESGIQILFVGLGCPKQEQWMSKHKGRVRAVMVGVGAAFDYLGGTKYEAPRWVQNIGLEFIFRLVSEPKRLWRRYIYYNPRFVWHFIKQLLNM